MRPRLHNHSTYTYQFFEIITLGRSLNSVRLMQIFLNNTHSGPKSNNVNNSTIKPSSYCLFKSISIIHAAHNVFIDTKIVHVAYSNERAKGRGCVQPSWAHKNSSCWKSPGEVSFFLTNDGLDQHKCVCVINTSMSFTTHLAFEDLVIVNMKFFLPCFSTNL